MHNHLLKCYKCPEVIKNELRKQNNQTTERISNTTDTSTPLYSENSQSEHLLIQPSTSLIQPDLCVIQPSTSAFQPYLSLTQSSPAASAAAQTSCQSLEEESVKRLTKKFARAVFVSGSPLSLVEHPLWIDFFKDLQPSFKLPSRKNLSESLLDNVHTEIKKEVTENLKQTSYLHLQCDGWTNVNNEGIINFVISNPEPYFVESLSTEENKHTSLYLSQEIIKVMRCYGETKFIVLIGDNARNIQKAFELVKMNSLLNKIVKEKKTGETLKLPVKTRWGSNLTALKSIRNTKTALMAFAIFDNGSGSIQVPSETKSTLLDDSFWSMINDCIAILEPITEPIFKLEANKCNIHEVFPIFRDLKSKLEFILPDITIISNEDKQAILFKVEKRSKDCIKPIHLAAYLLDPRAQGLTLNEDEDLEAMHFIEQMAQNLNIDVIVDLANYKARDGFWSKRFLWDRVEDIVPVTWWKGLCSSKNLSKIAVRILTSPCTSAATERSFSKHGHIHSRKRNRLTAERAAKLTFISYNWDLLNKFENTDCEDLEYDHDIITDLTVNSDNGQNNENDSDENPQEPTTASHGFDIEFYNCDSFSCSDED
ncbi:hypothetical protein ABMA28_013551 [Loxostege sticticalis]|uniref:Transposase n=1 Tax=Loxostege sticticalis TaxID=481309 RepID=A0ABD0TIY7_LOXSC